MGCACAVLERQGEGTDFEEFLYNERGLYGCHAAGRDEENMGVVGCTLELGNELAGHEKGVCRGLRSITSI